MKNTKKQNSKNAAPKQLIKKQLQARLNQKFEIPGYYITRDSLESMGFDTADVDDATMEELANRLGDIMYGDGDDATQVAEEIGIPKHTANPTA